MPLLKFLRSFTTWRIITSPDGLIDSPVNMTYAAGDVAAIDDANAARAIAAGAASLTDPPPPRVPARPAPVRRPADLEAPAETIVAALPSPEDDPKVLELAAQSRSLATAAADAARAIESARERAASAQRDLTAALGANDPRGISKAESLFDEATVAETKLRSRLEALRRSMAETEAALAGARRLATEACIPAWDETLQALRDREASATKAALDAAARVKFVERRFLALDAAAARPALVAVEFVESVRWPPVGAPGSHAATVYAAGERAGFPVEEAQHLVARGLARFVESWRQDATA